MKFGLFFSVFTFLVILLFIILYLRFFKNSFGGPSPLQFKVVGSFFFLLFAVMTVPPFLYRKSMGIYTYQGTLFQIMNAHYLILGLLSFLVVFTISIIGLEFVLKAFSAANLFASIDFNVERRIFLQKILNIFAVIGALGATTFAFFKATSAVKIVQVKIPKPSFLKNINLDGIRFIQMSDIHIGPTIGPEFVEQLVKSVNELAPDAVFITGDLLDGTIEQIGETIKLFLKIKAPIFFCLGNHEFYWGHERWSVFLDSIGLIVLTNNSYQLIIKEQSFLISGVPDSRVFKENYHPMRALFTIHPKDKNIRNIKNSFNILLAHRPTLIEESIQAGHHLQLSGHTHSGQFSPWTTLVKLIHRYYKGAYFFNDFTLYVSPGTGYWGPPLRTVESEITLLEFV